MSPDKTHYLKRLGNRIRIARKRKGWTQTRLATELGLKPSGLSKIERGQVNPNIIQLRTIKTALDMEWEEVFTRLVMVY